MFGQYSCVQWITSNMNSSLHHKQCLVYLTWMFCEMRVKYPYNYCFCTKRYAVSLCSFHLAFSPGVRLMFKWCNHTIVRTQLQLGRILALSKRSNFHKPRKITITMSAMLILTAFFFRFYYWSKMNKKNITNLISIRLCNILSKHYNVSVIR